MKNTRRSPPPRKQRSRPTTSPPKPARSTEPPLEGELVDEFDLNPRQRAFAEAYAFGGNATRAYIEAGYTVKNEQVAAVGGSELLRNPKVAAYIDRRAREALAKASITAERILTESARSAFLDPLQAFDEHGKLLPLNKMPEDVRRAIASIEFAEDGKPVKVRFIDKTRNVELLGRHLRLWTDKDVAPVVPAPGPVTINHNTLNVTISPLEAYKRMLAAPRE